MRTSDSKTVTLRKKRPYSELFLSVFSRIRAEYGERYAVSLRIQSECGKIRTRITPNTDSFNAVRTPYFDQKL